MIPLNVTEIIKQCKSAKINFIPRDKNLIFLRKINITIDEAINYVRQLTVNDFVKAVDDRDIRYSGKLWIFKRLIKKYYCYIKIKYINNEEGLIVVISFHEDEK